MEMRRSRIEARFGEKEAALPTTPELELIAGRACLQGLCGDNRQNYCVFGG